MNSYTMEVSAEVRRQALLDEAELRRLVRTIADGPSDRRPRRPRSPLALVQRLARPARRRWSRPRSSDRAIVLLPGCE